MKVRFFKLFYRFAYPFPQNILDERVPVAPTWIHRCLPDSVTVAHVVLVHSVEVRILVGQPMKGMDYA